MLACSSREKSNEKQILDLQNAVAQIRQEVRRSNEVVSDLVGNMQKTLQKCTLRLAEVDVELEKTTSQITRLDADLQKSNQHVNSVEDALLRSKQHLVTVEETLHKSSKHTFALEDTIQKSSQYMLTVEDRIREIKTAGDSGSVAGSRAPSSNGDYADKKGGNLSSLQVHYENESSFYGAIPHPSLSRDSNEDRPRSGPPSLISASSVRNLSMQERVASLELLVSQLWQFHTNFFMLPPGPPASDPYKPSHDFKVNKYGAARYNYNQADARKISPLRGVHSGQYYNNGEPIESYSV
jgi:hypothetical protein